jgi:hypothetical protein
VQSLQVPNSEERAAPDDTADDETCTAGMELPLQHEVRERERNGVGNLQDCKTGAAMRAGPGFRPITVT